MPLISKPNYNQIFASQAPEQDKPAVFNNYPEGWGPESRPNNGKPTIKGFNYLQQTSDLKDLWILQNGAALPYDATMEYAEGAVVVKDGELQQWKGGEWRTATNKGYSLDYFVSGKAYPLHAEIMLENGDIVKSTIDGNTVDPNVDMTGWRFDDNTVESIADLITINNPKDGQVVFVKSYHAGLNKGGDLFEYKPTRQSENDGGNIINGWERKAGKNYLNAYNFGAKGLGLQDDYADHEAFRKMKDYVIKSSDKAFVIHIPHGDYVVIKQTFTAGVGFAWEDALNISFATMTDKRIILQSDDAKVSVRRGLKYGVFDKNTGEVFNTTMPFYPNTPSYVQDKDKITIGQFGHVFNFNNIKGLITRGVLNIDGSRDSAIVGGKYGDVDWQLSSYGFRLAYIESFEISNITSDNNCLDGLYVCGYNSNDATLRNIPLPHVRGVVRKVTTSNNGRQGCSFTGGQNISWYDCSFNNSGLPTFNIYSMPRSNFDIEAELLPIRNAKFYNCYFGHAGASSLVADSADSRNVQFFSCSFVNAVGSVCWVRKPEYKFFDCYFNGYMDGQYNTEIESDRTIYDQCVFTDDPEVNPNMGIRTYLLNLSGSNPKLNDCTLKFYKSGAIYNYGYTGKLPFEFNRAIVEVYGGDAKWAVSGIGTMRIRDKRPEDQRPTKYLTFSTIWDGTVVVENLDGIGGLVLAGTTYKVQTTVLPDNKAFLPRGSSVANATGTDDTATKLNSLIASLKSVGYIN